MIFTERTITVVNDSATINKPLILYRGDKNIELKITIAESQFKFRNTDASNVIETTDASYAQLVINTPYNSPIFSDVAATKNGAVIFVITEAMIDEIREVGAYEIQIRLLDDNKQSRASIPPVSNAIEIREPIAIEDGSAVDSNAVNVAKVNRALTTTSAPLEAFDSQGNYIKKTWGDGDPITDAALNKMEAAIDGVNKKIGNNRSQIKDIASEVNNLKENGTGTIPNNVALLEDVTVDGETEDYIPLMALNGTEYRLTINNLGVPVIKNINGDIVFTCGTGSSEGGGDTPSTPVVPSGSWVNGVAYSDFGWIEGYYIDKGTGQAVASSTWSISEYMNCEGVDYLEGQCENNKYNGFFTSSKEFISEFGIGGISGKIVAIPTNASYFRLSNETSKLSEVNITPYKKIDATWSDGVSYNLELIANKYYVSGNVIDYAGWSVTDYTNCSYASKLSILSPNGNLSSNYCSFFDINKKAISGMVTINQTTDGTPVEVTVPINACYFVLSAETTTMNSLTVTPIA